MKVGSDFSGVGAFDQALIRLGIKHETIFACDMDKYARQTYIQNYGEPKHFPKDVYDRKIPAESLDLYMSSPPCQAFSLSGLRLGKEDKRGILFFNSYEFIQKNKPRFFIFENVKGLLSHDDGRTFQEWLNLLGGKSINGLPMLFPDDNAVPYHIYYKVINAKKLNVPQNRERVFIIGIRDDKDNSFQFPKDEPLIKKLKDVIQDEADEKYFLSDKLIERLSINKRAIGFTNAEFKENANCIIAGYYKLPTDGEYIKVKSATKKGYEEAKEGDSINLSVPNSETRRGRVGKEVAQTLDTQCNQATWIADYRYDEGLRIRQDGNSPCIHTRDPHIINYSGKIRRLTPRECFRLMDFPESFTWSCSDSQAYKQAGNSIVVKCLEKIINNLKL